MKDNRVRNYVTTAILFLAFVLLLWLVLGAIWGAWFAVPFVTNQPEDKYEVFNALLTIFLRLTTVLIAIMGAVGAGAYYVLKHRITEDAKDQTTKAVNERITEAETKFTEVTKAAEDRFNKLKEEAENKFSKATEDAKGSVSRATQEERERDLLELIDIKLALSYDYWKIWNSLAENSDKSKHIEWLERAITWARTARDLLKGAGTKVGGDDIKQKIQEFDLRSRNNLAYYLADWPQENGPYGQPRHVRIAEVHELINGWYQERRHSLQTEPDWTMLETCA